MTPTARSLALLRATGHAVDVVERYLHHCRRKRDCLGIGDLIAVRRGESGAQAAIGERSAAAVRAAAVRLLGGGEPAVADDDVPDPAAAAAAVSDAERQVAVVTTAMTMQTERVATARREAQAAGESVLAGQVHALEARAADAIAALARALEDFEEAQEGAQGCGYAVRGPLLDLHRRFGLAHRHWLPERLRQCQAALAPAESPPAPASAGGSESIRARLAGLRARDDRLAALERGLRANLPPDDPGDPDQRHRYQPAAERSYREQLDGIANERRNLAAAIRQSEAELAAVEAEATVA